jgi:type VI protein secretion system component Hcp
MVGHQAISEESNTRQSLDGLHHDRFERREVMVIVKDCRSRVGAIDDVIDISGFGGTAGASHNPSKRKNANKKVPDTFLPCNTLMWIALLLSREAAGLTSRSICGVPNPSSRSISHGLVCQVRRCAGGATDKLHFAWTNAAAVQLTGNMAGGGTGVRLIGGRAHVAEVAIAILRDVSTGKLLETAFNGRVFKKVVIHATAKRGDVDKLYLEVELKNAQITNYQIGVLDNDAATDDVICTLAFDGYKSVYHDADGRGDKDNKVDYEWKVGG